MTANEGIGGAPPNGGPALTTDDVADSTAALVETYRRPDGNGIAVADGFGVQITVDRGALSVADGVGPHRRVRRFERATHGLRRVVVMGGTTGVLSLDALTWCHRLGIGVTVLAPGGREVAFSSAPSTLDDARLRRVQALAPDLPVGLDIARGLLARKLAGQAALIRSRFGDSEVSGTITDLAGALAEVESVDEGRQLEATAAALYWQSWAGRDECVPSFIVRDRRRIPPHWTRYEGRRSVLASGNANRKAERPTNAILSYLYALLESEAVMACHAVALDPGLGIVHFDTRSRPSLALDLIEPVRPEVDAWCLTLLARRTFRKADFIERPDGQCYLRSPLTHELAETLPRWAKALAPVAESVAHALGQAIAGKYQPSTPLTGSRLRSAQAVVKARKKAARSTAKTIVVAQRPGAVVTPTLWACPDCGGPVENPRHVRCDKCIAADPLQTPEVRGRRGAAIASRKRALSEWDRAHPDVVYDPEWFRRELHPRLGSVKLAAIMEAAGCSKGFASDIRTGRHKPHVSTWGALAALVGVRPPDPAPGP